MPVRPSRKRLPLYTFAAVFAAIAVTGAVIVPFVLRAVEAEYIALQADVNARQARALGQFVEARLAQGVSQEQVVREFQLVIANSEIDRGFSCMIDRASAAFLSHPMEQIIGRPVSAKNAVFENWRGRGTDATWERAIADGVSAAGVLRLPGDQSEVVYMYSVPSTDWTISTHENTARVDAELGAMRARLLGGALLLGLLLAVPASIASRRVSRRYESMIEEQHQTIQIEKERSERLLLNVLPEPVADQLKAGRETIAERHADVTVLFGDIVGFTSLSSMRPAEEVVGILNRIFSRFDDLATHHGLEKIKTIGDAYMVCGGLPDPSPDSTARVADMALDMIAAIRELDAELDLGLELRIGINAGEVVAGVIGKQKFIYDLWGDVVNTASRMESSGIPGRIHVTETIRQRLGDRYRFEDCGVGRFKGKGRLQTYLLDAAVARRASPARTAAPVV